MTDVTQPPLDAEQKPEQTGSDSLPAVPTAREIKFREMAEARAAEVAAEIAQSKAEAPSLQPEEQKPETPEQTPEPPTQTSTGKFIEREGKQFVTLKVNGKEQEVELGEVIKRAQKDVAADVRLQQAAERERLARQAQAEAEAARAQLTAQLASVTTAPKVADTQVEQAALDEVIDLFDKGDIQGAKPALAKLIAGRPQTTPVNPELIAAQVRESLRRETEAARQAAFEHSLVEGLQAFERDFPEIASDPRLSAYADKETEIIMREEPQLSPVEVMRKAGENVRKLIAPQAPAPLSREQRKAANPPVAVNGATVTVQKAPPPQSPSTMSVIDQMRKARGQPTASG